MNAGAPAPVTLTAVLVVVLMAVTGYLVFRAARAQRRAREARLILSERAREPSELSHHLRANPEAARAGAESFVLDPASVPERRPRKHGPDGRFLPHDVTDSTPTRRRAGFVSPAQKDTPS